MKTIEEEGGQAEKERTLSPELLLSQEALSDPSQPLLPLPP